MVILLMMLVMEVDERHRCLEGHRCLEWVVLRIRMILHQWMLEYHGMGRIGGGVVGLLCYLEGFCETLERWFLQFCCSFLSQSL